MNEQLRSLMQTYIKQSKITSRSRSNRPVIVVLYSRKTIMHYIKQKHYRHGLLYFCVGAIPGFPFFFSLQSYQESVSNQCRSDNGTTIRHDLYIVHGIGSFMPLFLSSCLFFKLIWRVSSLRTRTYFRRSFLSPANKV